MLNLIIWFATCFCHNPNHTVQHHGTCNLIHISTAPFDDDDTGGETGGTHKPPPPPSPPTGE